MYKSTSNKSKMEFLEPIEMVTPKCFIVIDAKLAKMFVQCLQRMYM